MQEEKFLVYNLLAWVIRSDQFFDGHFDVLMVIFKKLHDKAIF